MACLTLASNLAIRPRTAADRDRYGVVVTDRARDQLPWEEIVMTTRRDFLKAGTAAVTAGIVFCSCGLKQSAHAQQATRQKLPVMVGGKRVKTIDVHAHCHFREAGALLGADAAAAQLPPVNNAAEAFIEIDKRLPPPDAAAGRPRGAS